VFKAAEILCASSSEKDIDRRKAATASISGESHGGGREDLSLLPGEKVWQITQERKIPESGKSLPSYKGVVKRGEGPDRNVKDLRGGRKVKKVRKD